MMEMQTTKGRWAKLCLCPVAPLMCLGRPAGCMKAILCSPTPKRDYHLGSKLLPKAGVNSTAHGFCSSFRDWAGEQSGASHQAMERALAHTIRNKAEPAYARTDLFEQRRQLMAAWAHYLGDRGGKVIELAPRR